MEKKYCNCAGCGRTLVGASTAHLAHKDEPKVAGRILERPYCNGCLSSSRGIPVRAGLREETGPWQDNAIRALEGD